MTQNDFRSRPERSSMSHLYGHGDHRQSSGGCSNNQSSSQANGSSSYRRQSGGRTNGHSNGNSNGQHYGQNHGQGNGSEVRQIGSMFEGANTSIPASIQNFPHPTLRRNYKIQPHRYFVVGEVFLVLWSEPAGDGATTNSLASEGTYVTGLYNERIFSQIRRMVVIREGDRSCVCFPIFTYTGQGVAKRGVNPRTHSPISTLSTPPDIDQQREQGMKGLIKMVPRNHTVRLDGKSRLNYGNPQTIQHNWKVCPIGRISECSFRDFHEFGREAMALPALDR